MTYFKLHNFTNVEETPSNEYYLLLYILLPLLLDLHFLKETIVFMLTLICAFLLIVVMLTYTTLSSPFILKGTTGCFCLFCPTLSATGGRLQPAGCGGCRPRSGDELRAGRLCPGGCSWPCRPAPAALGSHEASADEAPSSQSEAESGRRQRACTGASGSPGRGRVWLILVRTRASPPACWAPMSSSRFMDTSSPTHCRTTAG